MSCWTPKILFLENNEHDESHLHIIAHLNCSQLSHNEEETVFTSSTLKIEQRNGILYPEFNTHLLRHWIFLPFTACKSFSKDL